MKGLRVARDQDGVLVGLSVIAAPVVDQLTDCYWIVSDCLWRAEVNGVRNDDAWFDRLVLAEGGRRRLFKRGALAEIAPFIDNDWCHLHGIPEKLDPSAVDLSREFVEQRVRAYFTCVDGVRWEVYSNDSALLDAIRHALPQAETAELSNAPNYG